MEENPTTTSTRPWRILVHDPDRTDAKFILTTVASPGDVRPADPAVAALDKVTTAWVAARHGLAHIALTQLRHATVWRVDEES
jgi:hypothetical protein